jgi:hypothetical protein
MEMKLKHQITREEKFKGLPLHDAAIFIYSLLHQKMYFPGKPPYSRHASCSCFFVSELSVLHLDYGNK